jgi:hypothetical protein
MDSGIPSHPTEWRSKRQCPVSHRCRTGLYHDVQCFSHPRTSYRQELLPFLNKILLDNLLPITKNAVELGLDEWESDLPQRPEGQTVLDLIVNGSPPILLLEAMRVHPELIRTVQLLIHKLPRRVPASNPGLPA